MADTPETPTTPPAETPKPADDTQAKTQRDIESEKNRSFSQRMYEQLKGTNIFGGLHGQDKAEVSTAPTFLDFLLRGSEAVSTTSRVSMRDDLQKIPNFAGMPTLRLSITKISTGLGMRVDEVLTKSRDEVLKVVTTSYDTIKSQIVTSQKAIATVDKNVRLVDTRSKKFQKETGKTLETLDAQLRKLQRSQADYDIKFKKIDMGQKKNRS